MACWPRLLLLLVGGSALLSSTACFFSVPENLWQRDGAREITRRDQGGHDLLVEADMDGAAGDSAPPFDQRLADRALLADMPLVPDKPPLVPDRPSLVPDKPPLVPDKPCTPSVVTLTFPAVADAYVDASLPTTNYGTSTVLMVDTAPDQHAYLRFVVAGQSGTVQSVTLRLAVAVNPTVDGPAIHSTSNSWTEAGITWSTRPAPAPAVLVDLGAVAVGLLEAPLPVTAVAGNGTYSFVLITTSIDGVDFQSRESSIGPALVVTSLVCK